MKKLNILLLGVGGNVTQGILAALNENRENYNIIGSCVSKESIGLYMCDEAYISPYANDKNFLKWLIEICNYKNVDIILTGVEEIIFEITKNLKLLNQETKALFIGSDLNKLEIGNDKLKTCIWLKENELNYPKFVDGEKLLEIKNLEEIIGLPFIAKPKAGKGSQGIYLIKTKEELKNINELKDYILQEYLGTEEEEYTVGCYTDKKDNTKIIILKRKLKYGTTFMAEIVQNEIVYEEAQKICKKFKARGPLNIQMRIHNGKAIAFELNVRFSGTTPFRAKWGFNDVKAMIDEYIYNNEINLKPLLEAKGYRYFNELYIDLNMEKKLLKDKECINCYSNEEQFRGKK